MSYLIHCIFDEHVMMVMSTHLLSHLLRLLSINTHCHCIHSVSKVNKVPALSDALSCDLLFRDLMFSTVFRRFLRPPKPFNHPLQRLQPAATCNSTVSEIDALIFPTVPRKFREKAVNKTVREFRLNSDQEKVLSLVSGWFAADSEGGEGMSSDVILVRGVFGSGKSHLLASVCVLLKRLSNIASAGAAAAAAAASGGTGPSAQTSTALPGVSKLAITPVLTGFPSFGSEPC